MRGRVLTATRTLTILLNTESSFDAPRWKSPVRYCDIVPGVTILSISVCICTSSDGLPIEMNYSILPPYYRNVSETCLDKWQMAKAQKTKGVPSGKLDQFHWVETSSIKINDQR
jgi:hypothetical protein